MNIILLIMICLIIISLLPFTRTITSSNNLFLNKKRTDSIKGIAALMVVISHIMAANIWISEKLIGGGGYGKNYRHMGRFGCFTVFCSLWIWLRIFCEEGREKSKHCIEMVSCAFY